MEQALEKMKYARIFHFDIKPDNIMVREDTEFYEFEIVDLGFADYEKDKRSLVFHLNLFYQKPHAF